MNSPFEVIDMLTFRVFHALLKFLYFSFAVLDGTLKQNYLAITMLIHVFHDLLATTGFLLLPMLQNILSNFFQAFIPMFNPGCSCHSFLCVDGSTVKIEKLRKSTNHISTIELHLSDEGIFRQIQAFNV